MISRVAIEVTAFILFVGGVAGVGYFVGYTAAMQNAKKNLAAFLLRREMELSGQAFPPTPPNKPKNKHKFHVFTNDKLSK